jgi:5-hydroxyisourate hydrolase-like protein (transthyretin family)
MKQKYICGIILASLSVLIPSSETTAVAQESLDGLKPSLNIRFDPIEVSDEQTVYVHVVDESKDTPADGVGVTLVLSEGNGNEQTNYYYTGTTDSQGDAQFDFSVYHPGEYQVMAQIDGKGYEDAAVQWFNAVEKYYG